MRELMNLVNDIAPLVKIGWLIFFVWALGQIAWYRRARVVTWPRIAPARPLPRKVAPPIARPAAARPVEDTPTAPAPAPESFEPMAASVVDPDAADAAGDTAPKPPRRRRRAASAATAQA